MRFWQAITQPPKIGFDRSINEIGRKITEVKEERDLNLNVRVRDLEDRLIGKPPLPAPR